MHHALQIQEILLNIFGHHRPELHGCDVEGTAPYLLALATTCRAFKEPALDVLWQELFDPSPIALCLPEASHISTPSDEIWIKHYSFNRLLTEIEWKTLRGYTRRIRSLRDITSTFDWESLNTSLNSPTTEPLFPNLRHLDVSHIAYIKHLLYMPFPSLVSLSIMSYRVVEPDVLHDSIESLSKFSPNINWLTINSWAPTPVDFLSSRICRWRDLRTVDCKTIILDTDALTHLSRMPALTELGCMLNATSPDSDSILSFPNLCNLTLHSEILDTILRFLARARIPSMTDFTAYIRSCPSKGDLSSFFTLIHTCGIGRTVQALELSQSFVSENLRSVEGAARSVLDWKVLHIWTAFSNLRCIHLDVECNLNLTDSELLSLASACPHLEGIFINVVWGWNTAGGITPNGVLQLLQIRPSFTRIGLAIDTRGYTEFRPSPDILGLTLPHLFLFHVTDSKLEAESVSAIADFIAWFISRSQLCQFGFSETTTYAGLWNAAHTRAKDAIGQGPMSACLFPLRCALRLFQARARRV